MNTRGTINAMLVAGVAVVFAVKGPVAFADDYVVSQDISDYTADRYAHQFPDGSWTTFDELWVELPIVGADISPGETVDVVLTFSPPICLLPRENAPFSIQLALDSGGGSHHGWGTSTFEFADAANIPSTLQGNVDLFGSSIKTMPRAEITGLLTDNALNGRFSGVRITFTLPESVPPVLSGSMVDFYLYTENVTVATEEEAYALPPTITQCTVQPVATAFEPPMGKKKKLGSTLPVKFQLFVGDDEMQSPEEIRGVLGASEPICPRILIYEITGVGVNLPEDEGNVGEGGDLGDCFRFSDGRWVFNLGLPQDTFYSGREYMVTVDVGGTELVPDNNLFEIK